MKKMKMLKKKKGGMSPNIGYEREYGRQKNEGVSGVGWGGKERKKRKKKKKKENNIKHKK